MFKQFRVPHLVLSTSLMAGGLDPVEEAEWFNSQLAEAGKDDGFKTVVALARSLRFAFS